MLYTALFNKRLIARTRISYTHTHRHKRAHAHAGSFARAHLHVIVLGSALQLEHILENESDVVAGDGFLL